MNRFGRAAQVAALLVALGAAQVAAVITFEAPAGDPGDPGSGGAGDRGDRGDQRDPGDQGDQRDRGDRPRFPARFRLAYTDAGAAVAEATAHDLFVLNADAARAAEAIKAANPAATVLVYKDLPFAADWDPTGISHGVGWEEAEAHDDWFLTDGAGARIESAGWPGNFLMDVTLEAYQSSWLANVERELENPVWDGVYIDDANWRSDFAGVAPAGYDDDSWRAATRAMLERVAPPLRERGALVVLNIGAGYAAPGLWQDWLELVDGAMEEHFAAFEDVGPVPAGDGGADPWRGQVAQVAAAGQLGKLTMVRLGGDGSVPTTRYAYASFLLVAGPGMFVAPPSPAVELPELGWQLGAPLGPSEEVEPGFFRREFEHAVVLVNAGTVARRAGTADVAPLSAVIHRRS